ncbi:MAG: hypothetical protein A2W22_00715 [Candidatus Levybacteria bacterium RBG_16_35_11]|nr:MAG: hypothetical protein A2W22_00715 [Candidatus Levybacteria bacterium RBG_16_35_11]
MKVKTRRCVSFKGLINTIKTTALTSFFLLMILFGLSTIVFGLNIASLQFFTYWYFMIILALSFGFQISKEIQPL